MLKKLVSEGVSAEVIAKKLGRSADSVYKKVSRLWLDDDGNKNRLPSSKSKIEPSADLLTPEQALDLLSDCMRKIRRGCLSKLELLEIRTTVQLVSRYYALYAKFVDYLELEKRLLELAEKYEKLVERQEQKNAQYEQR